MPPQTLIDHNGVTIRLGNELGRGGEAAVYELPDYPRFVAKVYHKRPDQDKAEKLSQMVALQSERILRLAAWPVAVLRVKQNGEVAGVALPNISGYKDVHLLYSPKSRIKEFPPEVNWPFLIHAAANVARAFDVIHEFGHVIGDVNQSNVRVAPTSVVSLLDCDSFQIHAGDRRFLCEMGVPLYTPPELQEKAFKNVVRTPNHDNFGLAILAFHLLFMGRHPFAGRFSGKADMPIEKAISEFRFAYAPDHVRSQMEPPPNSLTLSQVSSAVADLFVRAFSQSGVNSGRPRAVEWVSALTALETDLRKCAQNPAHYFFKQLTLCPWCSIEGHTGVTLFLGVLSPDGKTGFRADFVWAQIQSIKQPGPATAPDFRKLWSQVKATQEAKNAGWNRRVRFASALGLVLGAIIISLAIGFGAATFWVGLIAIGVGRSIWAKAGRIKRAYTSTCRSAESRHRSMQERWEKETSDAAFGQKLRHLEELKTQHAELPKLRQLKLQELQRKLHHYQLQRYLEQFAIAQAEIPHIGNTRTAMLASFGIDTAADVVRGAVDTVPGFGQFLVGHLLAWRASLEAGFVFNPNRGVHPDDLRALDKEISDQRRAIEAALVNGSPELVRIATQITVTRQSLASQLETATLEMFQAQANANAS